MRQPVEWTWIVFLVVALVAGAALLYIANSGVYGT